MPRIRTLRPEHRQHRKVGALSHRQYRLWVGMLCEADDDGRLIADPVQLRALIFSYHDDVPAAAVLDDLLDLHRAGLITLYFQSRPGGPTSLPKAHLIRAHAASTRSDAVATTLHEAVMRASWRLYAVFPDWKQHQYINPRHYTKSRLPSPPLFKPRSSTVPSPSQDGADTVPVPLDRKGREGKGSERKGGESEGRETASAFEAPSNGHDDDADVVLARALKITVAEVRQRREAANQRTETPRAPETPW